MLLKDLAGHLDNIFKKSLAPGWDKVGLQVGDLNKDIKSILTTLDINDYVTSEAIDRKADLILSHHPLIFNPVNTLVSSGYIEKKLLRIIENRIAVYCAHTNYDIMPGGLNEYLAEKLSLKKVRFIEEASTQWYKFVIFVPFEAQEKVRKAICRHGGGNWGNYSCCTFNLGGRGTFIPLAGSSPYVGEAEKLNFVDEVRIECIVDEDSLDDLVKAAIEAHPYEEAAYDIYKIENKFGGFGIGIIVRPEKEIKAQVFLKMVKDKLELEGLNWMAVGSGSNRKNPEGNLKDSRGSSKDLGELSTMMIKKVALSGGSANSIADKIAGFDCQAVLVGEMDYHNCLKIAESGKLLILIGHGSSEKVAVEHFSELLSEVVEKEKLKISIFKSKQGYKSWRYYIG